MLTTSPDTLKTKQHFDILDGLRGIAAIGVVVFHFMEMAIFDYSKNFIGHGFLAVDFFFCLSGFVIGYAYDDRMAKMGIAEFFKSRIIRLHPLVVFGSVLGLISFLLDPYGPAHLYSAGRTFLIFLSSILLIPYPVMTERSGNLFSFNAPAWSLFWEYVANIAYALFLYKVRRNILLIITVIAGAGICYIGYQSGNVMGGWGGSTFWDGCIRICYSFSAGLLVYRSNWIIKNKLGFPGMCVLLIAALTMPYFKWNPLMEVLVVVIYFPLLIALGAGAKLSEGLRKLCVFSGNISYPLYMTHYMVIWIFMGYYAANKPDNGQLAWIVLIGTILLLGFAYLVMTFYDIPLRRYLTNRRKEAMLKAAGKTS